MEPQINSQWKCAQGGGMIITVISKNDERNWDMENMDYKRKGEIIYIYSHNHKIGNIKTSFHRHRARAEYLKNIIRYHECKKNNPKSD